MFRHDYSSAIKRFYIILPLLLFATMATAVTTDVVSTFRDDHGWKLKVNNDDYFVKGVVWGYTPIGETYSYNLWANSDEHIRKVLDYECDLMKKAGINTIRVFGNVPPRWVQYIYEKHGIGRSSTTLWDATATRSMARGTCGRITPIRAPAKCWYNDFVEMVRKYKDTPGVLMFALGNENNYGLEWASFEIENIPEGERHKEKAKFLFSLYNEAMKEAKTVDPNHPYLIVNGDIQYIDLIKQYCTDMDILGVNAYRGVSFTDMWERVHDELGLPVMLTEFGSDAFNALTFKEEQEGQAHLVRGNWREIYNKSYDKGEEGNAIGGCIFEWRDEWWKYLQTENLDIHDKHASWSNGGYSFDFVHGRNNMNEEWFGICRLGEPNEDGVSTATTRMAYDVLSKIWHIDPYTTGKNEMNSRIDGIDMDFLSMKSTLRSITSEGLGNEKFKLAGGRIEGDVLFNGKSEKVEEDGKDGLEFSNGEMLFLDFEFQPTSRISGQFTLNLLGNVADKQLEQYYGKRGETYVTVTSEEDANGVKVNTTKEVTDNERIEIYDFEAKYEGEEFDFTAFYHVPRYHWGYEGDFFGLMHEATDMEGMDIWNAKAPYGVEFEGKKTFEGLKIVAGPEVYWGANPKAIVKYQFGTDKFEYTFVHSEDFSQAEASATATEATERATRQTALSLETDFIPGTTIQIGYLLSGTEKIDEEYEYVEDGQIYTDEIEFKDTQAAKAKLSFNLGGTVIDASVHYAGLVADGGETLVERNSTMPYSALGNKIVYEAGALIPIGDLWLLPRAMYRENLLDAVTASEPYTDGTELYPGTSPRNRDDDPFAVLDNREATSGEFFITWDPTPASYFYNWDREFKEDAPFAFTLGGNYTSYTTETDAYLFYYQEGETNASFGKGLPEEEVWELSGCFIMNPSPSLRVVTNLGFGKQQSTGNPNGDPAEFYTLDAKFIVNNRHLIKCYVKKDAWGPYDWYRQFNITYPYQYMLDYSVLIDNFLDEQVSSRIGYKTIFRTLDENSPTNEGAGADQDYEFQTGLYYRIDF